MIEVERLTVSLTKNGYLKIADLVKMHPRWEILENAEGIYPGINIKPSQVSKILSVDPSTGQPPECWDEIRSHSDDAIEAFTMVAIILSHHKLIELFKSSNQGGMRGYFNRDDLSEKEFTNLVYALASLELCNYRKGAESVNYDFHPLVYNLKDSSEPLKELIKVKLKACGWLDPDSFSHSTDGDIYASCRWLGLHEVFGMQQNRFRDWIEGTIKIDPPASDSVRRNSLRHRRPR